MCSAQLRHDAAAGRGGHLGHRALARPRRRRSTDAYLHADITIKEKALALTTPASARPGRYRPADKVLAFLESRDYAEAPTTDPPEAGPLPVASA